MFSSDISCVHRAFALKKNKNNDKEITLIDPVDLQI